jgi:PPOX class probable F420-dependent enzyme
MPPSLSLGIKARVRPHIFVRKGLSLPVRANHLTLAELSEMAKRLLKGKNFAFVATVNKDGSPHLTPTWIDTDGKNVLVNTALGRQKPKNVSRDSRVAVGVFDLANPYEYVSISGEVIKRVTGKEADEHIDKLAQKYTGAKKYKRNSPNEERVILVIRPSKELTM